MEASCARGPARWIGRIPQKVVASAALALAVAACGGGGAPGQVPIVAGGQRLAVTSSSTLPVGTIAERYAVINLASNGSVDWAGGGQPINERGQVAFRQWLGSGNRAMLFDGTSVLDVSPPGSTNIHFLGVGNAGEIFGSMCCVGSWPQWPFMRDAAGTVILAPQAVVPGFLNGFNNAGQGVISALADSRPRVWTPVTGNVAASTSFPGSASARAINETGTVVGIGRDGFSAYNRPFVWTPVATPDDVTWPAMPGNALGGDGTLINASGQIAGHYDSGTTQRGFWWRPGDAAVTELNVPAGHTSVNDMNSVGQIVGETHDLSTSRRVGFAWTPTAGGGNAVEITLGGSWAIANAINAGGLVVGVAQRPAGPAAAIAWTASQGVVDLNTRIPDASALGVKLEQAVAVSDTGAVVAFANTGLVLLQPGSVAIPTVGTIVANDPVPLNTVLAFSAGFNDADTSDSHTANWSWDDGTPDTAASITETNGTGTASASHAFAASGVYTVSVTVTDNTGRSATVSREIVVYDPAAGFVTGGGWIQSPPGAYKENLALVGRANFGFVSRYQKGATKPSGNTEFQFHAANLNFHSENYDWLVVAGARAQYKGVGTINGQGGYKFLLTAVDGAKLGGATPDRFRIRIWQYDTQAEQDVVVYDNQTDAGTEGGNSEGTAIGGGGIVVHSM